MYVVVVVGRGLLDECELKCIRKRMRIFYRERNNNNKVENIGNRKEIIII